MNALPFQTKLHAYILNKLQKLDPLGAATDLKNLTVGIEHEFFLLHESGRVVTHIEGQQFLNSLSQMPGWHVQETANDPILGEMLVRVSKDDPRGRFTAVKFDHHPHLFEIAVAYEESLDQLYSNLKLSFDAIHSAAHMNQLKVSSQCLLDIPGNHTSITSPLSDFVALRHYRTKLFEMRNEAPDPDAVNYASKIAATQIHIGGLKWWRDPQYLNRLYQLEPSTLNWGIRHAESASPSLLKERWKGYRAVFANYPLVGFPALPSWSIDNWVDALIRSPLAGGPRDPWAGHTINDLGQNPFSKMDDFWSSVRDLQSIRPKLYGTLEFRADPAQTTVEAIIGLAAFRLGLSIHALFGTTSPLKVPTFDEVRTSWWNAVITNTPIQDARIIHLAIAGLDKRNSNDCKWIESWTAQLKKAS